MNASFITDRQKWVGTIFHFDILFIIIQGYRGAKGYKSYSRPKYTWLQLRLNRPFPDATLLNRTKQTCKQFLLILCLDNEQILYRTYRIGIIFVAFRSIVKSICASRRFRAFIEVQKTILEWNYQDCISLYQVWVQLHCFFIGVKTTSQIQIKSLTLRGNSDCNLEINITYQQLGSIG